MTEPVLGARHREVDRLRRLTRRATERSAAGLFVVEGPTLVAAALAAAAPLEAVYVAAPNGRKFEDLLARATAAGVPVRELAPGVLERVADTATPQGVVALCRSVTVGLDAIATGGFVLVGVDVADPGNAGTMIRAAEATGARAVVFTGTSVDVTNPKVVRAAAGSLFHLPVVAARRPDPPIPEVDEGESAGAAAVLRALAASGRRLVGAAAHAGEASDVADLTGDLAIVVGNEAHGLPPSLALDGFVHVPMEGRAESLNVAVAAAILCYESARQRRGARRD